MLAYGAIERASGFIQRLHFDQRPRQLQFDVRIGWGHGERAAILRDRLRRLRLIFQQLAKIDARFRQIRRERDGPLEFGFGFLLRPAGE